MNFSMLVFYDSFENWNKKISIGTVIANRKCRVAKGMKGVAFIGHSMMESFMANDVTMDLMMTVGRLRQSSGSILAQFCHNSY